MNMNVPSKMIPLINNFQFIFQILWNIYGNFTYFRKKNNVNETGGNEFSRMRPKNIIQDKVHPIFCQALL